MQEADSGMPLGLASRTPSPRRGQHQTRGTHFLYSPAHHAYSSKGEIPSTEVAVLFRN